MLKLLGFPASNYYNMVKMALLEKGASYEDVRVFTGQTEEFLAKSPMGKVPCIETDQGYLSETSVILDYIEDAVDGPSFYPADAYGKARVRELIKYLELYIELPARRCYGESFFGSGPVSDEVKAEVQTTLQRGLRALRSQAKCSPYIAGDDVSYADFVFMNTFPMAAQTAQIVFDWDIYAEFPEAKALLDVLKDRPAAKTVAKDAREGMEEFRKAYGIS